MKFGDPITSIAYKKLSNFVRPRPIKIDSLAPIIFITISEIVSTVNRKVIPVGSKMVVHHIKNDAEFEFVCCIDKALERLMVAVRMRRRVETNPVVAPVAL